MCFYFLGLPYSASPYSSSVGLASGAPAAMNKASSLLDLGSSRYDTQKYVDIQLISSSQLVYWKILVYHSPFSSASSSPSLMSPMVAGPSDWAVPHASRLKYRQQFNSLDKQMTGYLTGMIPVHL